MCLYIYIYTCLYNKTSLIYAYRYVYVVYLYTRYIHTCMAVKEVLGFTTSVFQTCMTIEFKKAIDMISIYTCEYSLHIIHSRKC